MTKEDIGTAIADAFRKQFTTLEFERSQSFTEIEKCHAFWLDGEFDGCREYPFGGEARLYSLCPECKKGAVYAIRGRVSVTEVDGSPMIEFKGKINAIEK